MLNRINEIELTNVRCSLFLLKTRSSREKWPHVCRRWSKMAVVPSKNKLKMGSAGRYYGAYLIYDVANSCLATLHAKMPSPLDVTRANPPSPVHVQNPRKFCSKLFSSSYSFISFYISNYFFLFFLPHLYFSCYHSRSFYLVHFFLFSFVSHWISDRTFFFFFCISLLNLRNLRILILYRVIFFFFL